MPTQPQCALSCFPNFTFIHSRKRNIFLQWPWTLTLTLTYDLASDKIKMNPHAKYLCQRSFRSKTRQSRTANFAPVHTAEPPTGAASRWTRPNIASSLLLPNWPHYVETWRHPQNRKYITSCHVVRESPSNSHRQRVQKPFEVWKCGFRDMRADKHVDKIQTYIHADCNTSPLTWAK